MKVLINYLSRGIHPFSFVTAVIVLAVALLAVQGPFYLHQNGDVNYNYLLSGLDYWQLHPSGINDQPGILPKLWMALCIGITYGFRRFITTSDLPTDVLTHGELYLTLANIGVFVLIIWAFMRFLMLTYRHFHSKKIWFIVWLSFFASTQIIANIWIIKSESFLLLTCLLFGMALFKKYILQQQVSSTYCIALLFMGVLSKVLILPFLLLLFLGIKPNVWLKEILPIGIIFMSMVLFIWNEELSQFYTWITNTVKHSGVHGTGTQEYYAIETILPHILKTIKIAWVLFLALLVGLWVSIRQYINRPIIFLFFTAYILYIALVLKTPNAHYFMICFALLPAYLSLVFSKVELKPSPIIWSIVLLFIVLRCYSFSRLIAKKHQTFTTHTSPQGVQGYYSSTKEYALFQANMAQDSRHSDQLARIYPEQLFYYFDQQFYTMKGKVNKTLLPNRLTITGTSDYPTRDSSLTILSTTLEGANITYDVELKP